MTGRKREDDAVDRFSRKFHDAMRTVNADSFGELHSFAASPLGGQDWELADYLLAGIGQYCLIEFKADEVSAVAETRKALRHALCKILQENEDKRALAEDVHFIAWGEKAKEYVPILGSEETRLKLAIAPYPGKVCPLLGYAMVPSLFPSMTEEKFIDRFLNSQAVGADAERFSRYVAELYEIAGAAGGRGSTNLQGTVYVSVPPTSGAEAKLLEIEFAGLDHLFRLTKERKRDKTMKRGPSQSPGAPSRGSGPTL